MQNKLYKSRQDKIISGVFGGLAEYFNIDPTIIRIIGAVLIFASFFSVLIFYFIASVIIPERPIGSSNSQSEPGADQWDTPYAGNDVFKDKKYTSSNPETGRLIIGGLLVFLGIMFFAKQFLHWINFNFLWPVVLIVIGLAIVFKGRGRSF